VKISPVGDGLLASLVNNLGWTRDIVIVVPAPVLTELLARTGTGATLEVLNRSPIATGMVVDAT